MTNRTDAPLFLHAIGCPHRSQWAQTDADLYGSMEVVHISPGQAVKVHSSKVFDEKKQKRAHPERYFILVDHAYWGDGDMVFSSRPGTSSPGLRWNTVENLMTQSTEVEPGLTRWQITTNEEDVLEIEFLTP